MARIRQSGESRAPRSVLRNHTEGYALLCFITIALLMRAEDAGRGTETKEWPKRSFPLWVVHALLLTFMPYYKLPYTLYITAGICAMELP